MLVVLGFDSLDGARIETLETPAIDSLEESGTMQTFDGLDSSELATTVLWSSMLAGQNPKDLYPEYYNSSKTFNPWLEGEWGNSLLDSWPAQKAEGFLVRRMSSLFSRGTQEKIRDTVRTHFQKESFVSKRLGETESLLDAAKRPRLLSVPGIKFDTTNKELKGRLNISGGHDLGEATTARQFESDALQADVNRLIRTLYALRARENDLLVVHFFCLDLMQHLWADSTSKMQRWYGLYDHFLAQVLDATNEEDTVVVVSDHGMEDHGIHSKRAFFGATEQVWGDDEYHMEDLSEVLQRELTSGSHRPGDGPIDDEEGVTDEVAEHLRELGYFE